MTGNTDPVEKQLLADARGMSPEFSESLHQRTMRAMRQAEVRRRMVGPVMPWWRVGSAVAASLALAATGWLVYSEPEILDRVPRPAVLARVEVPAQQDGLLSSGELQRLLTPPAPPIGHIETQVRTAAEYLAGQFPPSLVAAPKQL